MVTVVNGLARERDGMVTATVRLDQPGTPWLTVTDPRTGDEIPALGEGVTYHPDGSLAEVTLTFRATAVPALGRRGYPLRPGPAPASSLGWSAADGTAIENDAYQVTADPARGGTITIADKRAGRDVLRGPGNELVLQDEYDRHPRWGEGPWHLSPKGPGTGSASLPATVRAERSPIGSRLLATFQLGGLSVTQETLLWDDADRVEFRTHVGGSIGKDRLLRVRFPADVPGGLPVYQTATAVIGRPFGAPEADVATRWWTLDNPANHWFGLGSVARVRLDAPGRGAVRQAIGVAEVITPNSPNGHRSLIRDLVISLGAAGVTATCSRSSGPRYGAVEVDSNLPDFRIALGGPDDNAFTAEVLAAVGPAAAKRLATLLADAGAARLWVPAAADRRGDGDEPRTDVRGPRDLPVLIMAGADEATLGAGIRELLADLADAEIGAETAEDAGGTDLAAGTVALFNRGTPSGVVTPDGTLWMGLMRACSSWPTGVWIDGDRRTAPDGSSFAWQHWSHTFRYALAATDDGWREASFNARAEEYNLDLLADVNDVTDMSDMSAVGMGGVAVKPANVTLTALKPRGNPLAAGLPGRPAGSAASARPGGPDGGEVAVRLRETDGRRTVASVRFAAPVSSTRLTDLLEESAGTPLPIRDGTVDVEIAPFGTVTLTATVGSATSVLENARLPEPVQPVYTRYWLHGTGPAPAGNMPVAVHFNPTRVTLDAHALGRARLSVACGPRPASGEAELIIPDALTAEIGDAPVLPGTRLRYDLPGGGFATWDVAVRGADGAAPGRYFLGARITDGLGQLLEDTVLVTVGELGGPSAELPPEELFFRLQSDVQALNAEAGLEVLTPELRLAPGEAGQLAVRVTSSLGSELRGEAQLISPFGSWEAAGPRAQPVMVRPGEAATVGFSVRLPATAAPGWQSWLLVKLMYFGRVRYARAVPLIVAELDFRRPVLVRRAEHDRGARGDAGRGADLLQQILQRHGGRDAHLEDVVLLARHAMAGLDRGEMTQPLRQVVGRGRVKWLDRHERRQRKADDRWVTQRHVAGDDAVGFQPADSLVYGGHGKPRLPGQFREAHAPVAG
jgi:hypothetical protein